MEKIDLAQIQIIVAAVGLALLWTIETVIPFLPNRRNRLTHSMRNIVIGVFNTIILAVLFAPVLFYLTTWTASINFGLLNSVDLPVWVSTVLAILLLDAWMYLWHRVNHRIGLLWRFHKVHHSDPEMDASTAVRFHTGEILISAVLRLGVILVLGLTFHQVLIYDLVLIPLILFHHSNIQFPQKLDRYYRIIFASPEMHRIHHSPERIETDSNYGSIFSFWDRLARSFRLRNNQDKVKYGLNEFIGNNTEKLSVLGLIPFQKSERIKINGKKSGNLDDSFVHRKEVFNLNQK